MNLPFWVSDLCRSFWEAVGYTTSNTAKFSQDHGEALYRRTLYTFWKRTAPPPSLITFDAPSRERFCLRRERTDTPLQALVTLNDPQFVEAARWLATAALKRGGDSTDARLDYMARRLLCRPLRPEEIHVVRGNFADLLTWLTETLSEHVKEVRLSTRLTDSPACLITEAFGVTPSLARIYRATGQDVPDNIEVGQPRRLAKLILGEKL